MKCILFLSMAAAVLAAGANADEPTREANNQEALTLAVSHQRADMQSRDTAGAAVLNQMSGPQAAFGYANTRVRNVLGVPGFYTRFEMALGWGRQDFTGDYIDPSTGLTAPSKGPFDVLSETARGRIGYGWELGPGGHVTVTPFLGLSEQAWRRNSTAAAGTAVSLQDAAEIGLLAQASFSRHWVLGADASVGHVLGVWQVDHGYAFVPSARIGTIASLYVDHRSDATSHERIVVQQNAMRFGEPAQSTGVLEPRRNSGLSIGLEFGTSANLFDELFH